VRNLVGPTLSRIGAAAVFVLLATAIQVVAAPGTAHARCDGHNEVKSQLLHPGVLLRAEEWPKPGACNSNNTYVGYIRSLSPSWRVTVWIQNDGDWDGWSCRYGQTCEYSYTDNNYYSYLHLCIDNAGQYICGWGEQAYDYFTHRAYGVNWAF
jgi:hypothetical protein